MVRAEVIRIDTIERYLHNVPTKQKQITWRDSDNLEYVTIVPMYAFYSVGTSMTMLKPRWSGAQITPNTDRRLNGSLITQMKETIPNLLNLSFFKGFITRRLLLKIYIR